VDFILFIRLLIKISSKIKIKNIRFEEDDSNWPEPDRVGRQELEILSGADHISFTTSKIGGLIFVQF
jgi:hypothetical protein